MRTNRPSVIGLLTSVLCLLAISIFTTGCASRSIEAASTRLKVSNVTGKSVEVSLPKNLDATNLKVSIDPATGKYELSADKLVTDASTVIETASAAQARAIEKLSGTLNQIVPLVVPPARASTPTPPAATAN